MQIDHVRRQAGVDQDRAEHLVRDRLVAQVREPDRPAEARNSTSASRAPSRCSWSCSVVHTDPSRDWSVASLAAELALSRSTFAARFTALVGEPVMTYVTRWRMLVAHDRLRRGDATVAALAAGLGYQSEAAFSRAFRRIVGESPGRVRSAARIDAGLVAAGA